MAKAKKKTSQRPHPWRLCPTGKHWVSTHPRKVDISTKNPEGVTIVDGHCRINPSHKDQIYSDEIKRIVKNNFPGLDVNITSDNLGFKRIGNKYDSIIEGWTKYWNEVLEPKDPLDPNLVKALIASESSFQKDAEVFAGKKAGKARGLMQITDWSLEILRDEKGELKDHLVNAAQKEMQDPEINIAVGIRWLFRKQETASSVLKRNANWIEAVADYKSYLGAYKKNPKHTQMNKFIKYYERLKK